MHRESRQPKLGSAFGKTDLVSMEKLRSGARFNSISVNNGNAEESVPFYPVRQQVKLKMGGRSHSTMQLKAPRLPHNAKVEHV